MPSPTSSPSLEQLERGLAVIQAFSAERPALTVSDASRITGINRAAARRILLTLENLGHVSSDGRYFRLTPGVLRLGWSYFASLGLDEIARPVLRRLSSQVEEACSLGTLHLPDVVYIAREYGQHHMTIAGGVGSRVPAHATALGITLLAHLDEGEVERYLAGEREAFTVNTVTDADAIRARLDDARISGWCLVDQELEIGLRGVAAPIFGSDRQAVASLSISSNAARTSLDELRERTLDPLLRAAQELTRALSRGAGLATGHGI